ncbi:MAG: hypothetical protein OXU76_04090 [Alphaproteobacteria bacterium]|nr:hypothetical protein [Alphaproteobacteria bacterium]
MPQALSQAKPTVARGGNFRMLFARLLFIVIYFPFYFFSIETAQYLYGRNTHMDAMQAHHKRTHTVNLTQRTPQLIHI